MSRQWTEQQLNSIYSTDGSVLVSAAAGSGKTAVLVERVINLITRDDNSVDVDRLLIVTFTRAAAAEMKERITDALNRLLKDDPYNQRLLKQKQLLPNASISTIDSFCSNTVKEYFHTLNVSSDFRIADESELDILKNQAMQKAFEAFYNHDDEDFIKLLDAFSGKNGDEDLRNTVSTISKFLSTQPFPDLWLDNMLKSYGERSVADSIWGKIIIDYALPAVAHAINLTQSSIKMLNESKVLFEKMSPLFESDLVFLEKLNKKLLEKNWDNIVSHLSTFVRGSLPTPRGYSEDPIKLAVSANRDEVKKTLSKINSCFCRNEEQAREELSELESIVSVLFDLVREFIANFDELKLKKNVLSFSDIESLTVKLLASPNADGSYTKTPQAYEISSRYDTVIVDEYQDVNDVQNLIFNCTSADGSNLFVVGDVKQSIYSFRQAKPQIFLSRKNKYYKFDSTSPKYPATIILDKNFRSRAEVCDTVNFIFSHIMTKQVASMDYTEDERLNVGASYKPSDDCDFDINLIDKSAFKDEDPIEAEARCIASRIHKIMGSDFLVTDGDTLRKPTYGDFAIILRKTNKIAVQYVKTLINCGIPAYCEENGSVFDAQEVKLLLNILRVTDNPTLDIPMLSVLCSPIYGFTPDELAKLRSQSRKTSLYMSLCKYAQTDKKCADFLNELDKLREYACTGTVDELIGKIMEMTALGAITSAVKDGNSPLQNLNLIRVYARSFESNGYKTLSDFILYIDRLIELGKDLSDSGNLDVSTFNGVRVLSIHKSKGLEFPICILADTSRKFNTDDLKKDVIIDSKSGLGIKRKQGVCRYKTLPRIAVEIEMLKDQLAEEMRILYVALTRAKEKLIMFSSVDNAEKYLSKLYSSLVFKTVIEPYAVAGCNCISSWVMLTALVNPSLAKLRRKIDSSAPLLPKGKDYPAWNFNLINSFGELYNCGFSEAPVNNFFENVGERGKTETDYAEILKQNLDFHYKNAEILSLPQKVSASQIAHTQNKAHFSKIIAKPAFLNKGRATAVERGTAHHTFLQYCDFSKAKTDIRSEINRLVSEKRLTPYQAESIDSSGLKRLLNLPLFDRIIKSQKILREERFTVKIKASDAFEEYQDIKTDAYVIMQGAVDLAFVEDGELVVADYKTDRVNDISKLLTLYKKQLLLYKEAMEQSTDYKVKELIICSVYLNEYIKIEED